MNKRNSAGILLYRLVNEKPEFLLVHPGGPFWKNKDEGAWSIPKGEFTEKEWAIDAARREFAEETGSQIEGELIELGTIRQKSGKLVYAWAAKGDMDTSNFQSNTFEMEWPPRSGKYSLFPEVDAARWFGIDDAKKKINPAQSPFLDILNDLIHH